MIAQNDKFFAEVLKVGNPN